jgi:hypothetical protein
MRRREFLGIAVLVQRFFTTLSSGEIGNSAHPNGAYKLAGPGHPLQGNTSVDVPPTSN